ncbi:MAG: hypothetical protein ACYC61_28755 [Isosphaeraceae bacterium]
MVRPRYSLRSLILAVLLVGLLLGGMELARRKRPENGLPGPPWEPILTPWVNGCFILVHMDDVRAGIDPPRMKVAYPVGNDKYRTGDLTGRLEPGEFNRLYGRWIDPKPAR